MGAEAGSFNLIDEPWIIARPTDAEPRLFSLSEVFADAGSIERLEGDAPTQDFAVLRLMLAIMRRALDWPHPDHPEAEWAELWRAEALPPDIGEYLDAHHDRFFLIGGQFPFYQVADLQYSTAGREPEPMVGLLPDVTARTHFPQRQPASWARLGAAEAARWLVHLQSFDASGIKSGTLGDPAVKGGKSYPIGTAWAGQLGGVYLTGSTLKETVLLNLTGQPALFADDLPSWERAVQGAAPAGREPNGLIDVLTWQSRRVRVAFDEAGRATGAIITNGDRLTPVNRHGVEHLSAWRRSPAQEKALKVSPVFMPRRHQPSRSLWRGLAAALGRMPEDRAAPPPGCVEWVTDLVELGYLPADFHIRLVAVGFEYGTQDAVITDSYFDSLDFAVGSISDPEVLQCVLRASGDADGAADKIARFARGLHMASGGHADQEGAAGTDGRSRAIAALDPVFRVWLSNLGAGADIADSERDWQATVDRALIGLANQMLAESPSRAWLGVPDRANPDRWWSAPIAESILRSDLRKSLPLAHPKEVPA